MVDESLGWYLSVPLLGPMPCDEAIEMVESFESQTSGSVSADWDRMGTLAWLLAYEGDVEQARAIMHEGDRRLRDLGMRETAAFMTQSIGWIELIAGNFEEADRRAAEAAAELEEMGSEIGGVLWSIRARALYELGRYDDAQDAVRKGDQLFSDLSTSLLQRSTEAMILAHRGLLPDAERIARDAVIQMDTSDWPSERGDMRMALAEILRLAGKMDESAEMMREAVALYESKGNALQAGTARTKLAALTG